jgi:predicted phosphodiesterase
MKFALASDLHLVYEGFDFLPVKAEGVSTLVLAGDTVEVDLLKQNTPHRDRIVDYLRELNKNFENVLYVMGNHEHYDNSFIHTEQNLRAQFKRAGLTNFTLLEKQTKEIDDTIFFGATMWTTFHNGNPSAMWDASILMNDYKAIHVGKATSAWGEKQKLTPEDTAAQCRRTLEKIKEFADLKTDKKKVLITHMAPCSLSISDSYKGNATNDAYYEDISEMLMDSDIRVAVHGHIHDPVYYTIGDVLVVSNPRGYHGYEPQTLCYEFQVVKV